MQIVLNPKQSRAVRFLVIASVILLIHLASTGCGAVLIGRELLSDNTMSAPPLEVEGLTQLTNDVFLYTNPKWSSDGSTIAVSKNDENDSPMGPFPFGWQVSLIDVESKKDTTMPADGWLAQTSPAWSPSNRLLAWIANDGTSNWIIITSLEDETRRELVCPSCDWPSWSRAGDSLLVGAIFPAATGGSGEFGLLALNAESGATLGEYPLGELFVSEFAFSPDGDTVLISDYDCTGIWSYSLKIKELTLFIDSADLRECDPTFSPDGSKIAYTVRDSRDGGFTSIVIANADGSSPMDLLRLESSIYPIFQPDWSPDGTRLAFVYGKNSRTSTAFSTLYIVDVPGELRP